MNSLESRPANTLSLAGSLDYSITETELHLPDGRIVRVPTSLLQEQTPPNQQEAKAEDGAILIPIVEEQLQVGKRTIETGRVRLQKSVEAYDVTLDEPLQGSTWKVVRVPKSEVVAEPPAPRQEGETTIYPLVEERLVVTKELVLIEEIYVTRELTERRDTRTVTLRRETLQVERDPLTA